MLETVTCPQCDRHLNLPEEYLGQEVQCPRCESSFIAGAARPPRKRPENPEAISATPLIEPVEGPDDEPIDGPPPEPRRARKARLKTPPPKRGINLLVLLAVLAIPGAMLLGAVYLFVRASNPFEPKFAVKPVDFKGIPQVAIPDPMVEVPDRLLNDDEQSDHARKFLAHFSAMVRGANKIGETACFDIHRLLDTMFDETLLPAGWQARRDALVDPVREEIWKASLYRGDHWVEYEIKTIKHPAPRQLLITTRHPHRPTNTSLRFRWWLAHRDGRWRIQQVEDIDYGIRLSFLVTAGLPDPDPRGATVHPEVRTLRDAAYAIVLRTDFAEAERLIAPLRIDNLPPCAGATHQLLLAWVRNRQLRHQETINACAAAQRLQPDLPGADYLLAVGYNHLRQYDLAGAHAEQARAWVGDDPNICMELGLSLQNRMRFAEAAPLYRKVLDDDPDHRNAMLNLLRCFEPDVKHEDIAARFDKMTQLPLCFEEFARDCWQGRDAPTLELLVEAMRKREPARPTLPYYLALAHAEQRRFGPALDAFGQALGKQNLGMPRDVVYLEFARVMALRDQGMAMYKTVPEPARSFRAIAEALRTLGRLDELQEIMDLHADTHGNDEFLALYQAELLLRDEQFERADKAYRRAFQAIRDPNVENQFRLNRVRARYQAGDPLSAYRDIGPPSQTFAQLVDLCWFDKKGAELEKLVEAHALKDPGDPQIVRAKRRAFLLAKRYKEGATLADAGNLAPGVDPERVRLEGFLYDMIDLGQTVEAYRLSPNPRLALDIILGDLRAPHQEAERMTILAEHVKRFPEDPLRLVVPAAQAFARRDWPKAGPAFREAWGQLPDHLRVRWTQPYLYARLKEGKAVEAYRESGMRVDHFRRLATMLLRDKQIDAYEALLAAHRPQRPIDADFDAYDARLKLLRGQTEMAATLFAGVVKTLPVHERNRIGDQLVNDLEPFALGVSVYRCLPDKHDAFGQLAVRYRLPDRIEKFEALINEHARLHPEDPRVLLERAELHMLRKEYPQAAEHFARAKTRSLPNPDAARLGLIRARVKLGKTVEAYRDAGPGTVAFQDVANQCILVKDGSELERLLEEHSRNFPQMKSRMAWLADAYFLKKDHAANAKLIQDHRDTLLKSQAHRWKCEAQLVRSLVRLKKIDEAIREAETINQRKDAAPVLLALALAGTGDAKRVLEFLESRKQRFLIEDCYRDEDLGPLLRSDAFKSVRDRFPPPLDMDVPIDPFDD